MFIAFSISLQVIAIGTMSPSLMYCWISSPKTGMRVLIILEISQVLYRFLIGYIDKVCSESINLSFLIISSIRIPYGNGVMAKISKSLLSPEYPNSEPSRFRSARSKSPAERCTIPCFSTMYVHAVPEKMILTSSKLIKNRVYKN